MRIVLSLLVGFFLGAYCASYSPPVHMVRESVEVAGFEPICLDFPEAAEKYGEEFAFSLIDSQAVAACYELGEE